MSGTVKTVLIVGAAAAGAYVVLQLVRGASAPAPARSAGSSGGTGYALVSGLANLGASFVNTFGGSGATTPVYVPGQGYVSGGAYAAIDPTTGGVLLPEGETYGPPSPY